MQLKVLYCLKVSYATRTIHFPKEVLKEENSGLLFNWYEPLSNIQLDSSSTQFNELFSRFSCLFASCYRNRDKLRPDGKLGLYTDVLSSSLL